MYAKDWTFFTLRYESIVTRFDVEVYAGEVVRCKNEKSERFTQGKCSIVTRLFGRITSAAGRITIDKIEIHCLWMRDE